MRQRHSILFKVFVFIAIGNMGLSVTAQIIRQKISFNSDWQFSNQEDFGATQQLLPNETGFTFSNWVNVCLPHTAKIEPLVIKEPWVGISWYKKDFMAKPDWKNKVVSIEFEAAMQVADVWLNGKHLLTHYGGYLPFTIDISKEIDFDKVNLLIVKTDNHDNAEVPPGKPISKLDFCYYSGIYRNVNLIITDKLYITDPVKENLTASGGVRIWFQNVLKQSASIFVSTHIRNDNVKDKEFILSYKLQDKSGRLVETINSEKLKMSANSNKSFLHEIKITDPELWHPYHPFLYTLQVSINENKSITDQVSTKFGIRKLDIVNERLMINGEPLLLVGTNRHQEYPYIGNALSDNAQYRDAVKIKEAGFNIVRLSHYPQSPAFMNACDELGILTIASIPGWQFVGNEKFMERSYQDARDLIRRDRNHPSVIFWELSLNESGMSDKFMQQMTTIAKEESPESKLITCGWINKFYDVWIPARQHAKSPNYWKNYSGKTPLFTGEYGDWEYFAQDAGLNQAGYAGLKSDERTSRQLRGDGEKRLLQQAANFQEAHNDNLNNPHLGDANWLMFDYNRGYSPDIESSGIMDIFRLPKFSYYLYKSQIKSYGFLNGIVDNPFVKIASYWNQDSDYKNLKVYSNCDEVAIYLNNKLIERKTANRVDISSQLTFPPFIFNLKMFENGQLKAVGYNKNKVETQDIVSTFGKPEFIKLTYDKSGKSLKADCADVVFVYATICDVDGNIVYNSDMSIQFIVNKNGKLIGQNPINAEAGIATILLQANNNPNNISVEAKSGNLNSAKISIVLEK
jgi:beta-galactosidase